jgi:hypothetical protein
LISLEVIVNGQRRTIAGRENAQLINATVSLYPEVKDGWLEVSGLVEPEGQPSANATWLQAALSLGDIVQVRLVDTQEVAAPNLSRTDPTAPATDTLPLVCAFCEKTHLEAPGMVASRKAMICPECVNYLHEMMHAPADEP